MRPSPLRRLLAIVVGAATMLVIAGVVLAVFFNPLWVSFEQRRADATAWTGFTDAQVQTATGSILSDLIFGPPRFDVAINGQVVLDARERQHMVDVRSVLLRFAALVLVAGLALVALGIGSRGAAWFWRAMSRGATLLAIAVVVGGALFALFFDAAFETFHELFFPAGSYTFNPGTERLVQLFPYAFWTETSIAIALAGIAASLGVATLAGRRARRLSEPGRIGGRLVETR